MVTLWLRLELMAVRVSFCSVRVSTKDADSVTLGLRLELMAVRSVFCSVRASLSVSDSVTVWLRWVCPVPY